MASRLFKQFCFSHIPMLSYIEGSVLIGTTGSVTSYTGSGVSSVTRLATGQYQVTMTDPFNRLLGADFTLVAPVSGSAVNDGSFVSGTVYEITTVGTTNWSTAGLNSSDTAATGMVFLASSTGGAGSGAAKVIGNTGIKTVELMGNPQTMVNQVVPYVTFQTLASAASGNTAPTPAAPVSGSTIMFNMFFRNSSLSGPGE